MGNNKFSLEKLSLSPVECDIIIALLKEGTHLHQEGIEKKINAKRSGISKALQRLINKGLIYEIKDTIKFYGINPIRLLEIKKFITGYESGKNKSLILSAHAIVFEAEINKLPNKFIKYLEKSKGFISYNPKNWKGLKKALIDGSYKFHKTKKGCKIIAYFRTFGFNPTIIEMVNTEKFLRLKNELEENYPGLKIGNCEFVASCPWVEYAIQKDPVAVAGIAFGIKHKKIEQSYGYPEWEEKGFDAREKIQKIIAMRDKEILE
jgi:predicted transcriptional regulator